MPKYIQRRKYHERKPHKFINNIEHKYCWRCIPPQWKPLDQFGKKENKTQHLCKACDARKAKQRRKLSKEKREKERETAPPGFSVCLNACCTVKGLQPVDQFISAYVRNNKATSHCLTCRSINIEKQKQRHADCQKVWDDWRKTHPCVKCMNDPNYKHNYLLIEADHLPEFEKVKKCSNIGYWCHSQRGVPALQAELMKCQASCKFHHALVTQQRRHDNGEIQKQGHLYLENVQLLIKRNISEAAASYANEF